MERLLEVKDLSISFGGIKAVQDLNFHIDKGEVLALIGPNGSGKSTTVNMISGVYIQNKGTITFDGKEIPTKMSIADRAKLGIALRNLLLISMCLTIFIQSHCSRIQKHRRWN